jgi:UDP-N-acetylmuramoyl-L-alanyl-D-glutamate--2,6-diaminopimelate ligase
VLTSDNPRGEDPIGHHRPSAPGPQRDPGQVIVEPDRQRAIAFAIAEARRGDLVLLAGKGHEKTQTIGDRVIPFDDVAIARQDIAGQGKKLMKLQLRDIAYWTGG